MKRATPFDGGERLESVTSQRTDRGFYDVDLSGYDQEAAYQDSLRKDSSNGATRNQDGTERTIHP